MPIMPITSNDPPQTGNLLSPADEKPVKQALRQMRRHSKVLVRARGGQPGLRFSLSRYQTGFLPERRDARRLLLRQAHSCQTVQGEEWDIARFGVPHCPLEEPVIVNLRGP
jgi:hypothetical protein